MTSCYGLLVSSEEISTAEAAEVMGVSEDTVRIMIADGRLPAQTDRPRGHWRIARADAETARGQHRGPRGTAGRSTLTSADLAQAAQYQREYIEAVESRRKAEAKSRRDEFVGALANEAQGFGTVSGLAEAMGVHRVTVRKIADKYRAARSDAEQGRKRRAVAGPSMLTRADIDEAVRAVEEYEAAVRDRAAAKERRDEIIGRVAADLEGYGSVADLARELGMHRVTVQDLKAKYEGRSS